MVAILCNKAHFREHIVKAAMLDRMMYNRGGSRNEERVAARENRRCIGES